MASDIIFQNILESMTDGVMTIGLDGRVLTFNAAAEEILGLAGQEVLGKAFGEVFLTREENDQFNQAILNAIYDAGTIQNLIVPWHREDGLRNLKVATSFLSKTEGGVRKNVAVIVVFSDITELERLQVSEQRLTEELKENHQALQKAYLEMEEANTNLQTALRKVQIIRIGATAFVILLFLGIGLFTWKRTHAPTGAPPPARSGEAAQRTYVVAPQTLTDTITLNGVLKPIQVVNITSPFGGMVKEVHFEYGQAVKKGQLLLKLDRAETEVKYREARTAFIEAQEKMREFERWQDGNEMAKARQAVTRSKLALDGYNKTFQETERLFKKEIVPATEYATAKQQLATSQMDYESSLREMESVRQKGEGDNRLVARLKLENARQKMRDLEEQLRHSDVVAPVSGTVLLPELAGDKDKKGKTVDRGVSFAQGDILLSIGNTEGLSMSAEVDELEVLKVKAGQEVRVTIDAFGETLKGRVAHISSQAVKAEGGKKAARFDVSVAMDVLPQGLHEKIRLGMSANMDIMLLNKPNVLMVPVQAVGTDGKDRVVSVRDKGAKSVRKVKVETGMTTVDSVEITSGLKAGDEVVFQ